MFEDIFINKSNKLATLIKLGDSLGRALRENVVIFSVDSDTDKVSYLTESGKVITGVADYNSNYPILENISVQEASLLMDEERYNKYLDTHISTLLSNLHEDQESEADTSLSFILNLWQNRLLLSKREQQLKEKRKTVQDFTDIVNTDTFQRLVEIKDSLITFLSENKEKVQTIQELKNAVNLAKQVSTAFNLPKVTYDQLQESSFSYDEPVTGSIYNLICRQELLKKELLESKKQFSKIWYTNDAIKNLAGCIYEEDDKVAQALAGAIAEVPYFALVSKKDIRDTISNVLGTTYNSISNFDIQKYSSKLFELKKPVKEEIIKILNEKYGINILTLKETPSFKSLLNTEVVIFECLSKISPKSSVQKSVLQEVSDLLKRKNGVESIDVADFLHEIFNKSGCTELIKEGQLESYLDFNRIADDMESISGVLRMIKAKMGGGMGADPSMGGDPSMQGAPTPAPQPGMAPQGGPPMPGEQPNPALAPDPATDGDFEPGGPEDDDVGMGTMPAEDVPIDSDDELRAAGDDSMAGPPEQEMQSDELMANISDLESLLQDLKAELGVDDETLEAEAPMDDEMPPEEGMEEEMPPEEGEEFEGEFDEEGDEETEGEFGGEETEEAPEEDETDGKKKKKSKKSSKKVKLDGPDKEIPVEKVK